jgi:hypothetical protein
VYLTSYNKFLACLVLFKLSCRLNVYLLIDKQVSRREDCRQNDLAKELPPKFARLGISVLIILDAYTVGKTFMRPKFTDFRNKLECLSLVGLSILVHCLRVRLERPDKEKYFSLLQKFANYRCKKYFFNKVH